MTMNRATGKFVKKRHDNRMKQKADIFYTRAAGDKVQKLEAMNAVASPDDSDAWTKLDESEWTGKFVPSSAASLSDGVPLESVFPWYLSGSKTGRSWVIAPTEHALKSRLKKLVSTPDNDEGQTLFADSPEGRKYLKSTKSQLIDESSSRSQAVSELDSEQGISVRRYGYRSFDREYCIADHRFVDRPGLTWHVGRNEQQVFFTSLSATAVGNGPAVTATPYPADIHHFRGSYGARDVYPLYRSAHSPEANVAAGLLAVLTSAYGRSVTPEEVACYVMGQLGTEAYTRRFGDELAESPAMVIFTKDVKLFERVVSLGRTLIFEASWGERMSEINKFGVSITERFRGKAACKKATTVYPESWSYDESSRTLTVGEGEFVGVDPEVMNFQVSDTSVVASWLGSRMEAPSGVISSDLNYIHADEWNHNQELLELLWQLEFFIQKTPEAAELLERVIQGDKVLPIEIGTPLESEQAEPKPKDDNQTGLALQID